MEQLGDLASYLLSIGPADLVDILLVASLLYAVLYVVRGTRAVELLRGILLLILVVFLFSQVARLRAFSWLVALLVPVFLVALPVIFQPELRRALERLGRAGLLRGRSVDGSAADNIVSIVSLAARQLSEARHGALIVLERETGLDDLAELGVALDAVATVDLLTQLFYPNTPLHDGAVIIRDGRIAAAGVVLPLSDSHAGDRGFGTRHLAALSVTENTDAFAVIVSEETGTISLAREGALIRHLDEGELSRLLYRRFVTPPSPAERLFAPLLARGRDDRAAPAGEENGVERALAAASEEEA